MVRQFAQNVQQGLVRKRLGQTYLGTGAVGNSLSLSFRAIGGCVDAPLDHYRYQICNIRSATVASFGALDISNLELEWLVI